MRVFVAALGLLSSMSCTAVLAATCTRAVDYPLTMEYLEPQAVQIAEVGRAFAHARYQASVAVDVNMDRDLAASVAGNCYQELIGHTGYGTVSTAGYCTAFYSISSELTVHRPSTGKTWYLYNAEDHVELGKFGGVLQQAHQHPVQVSGKNAKRAKQGDVVTLNARGQVEAMCFGDPDMIADLGSSTYHWGEAPAPKVRIWMP